MPFAANLHYLQYRAAADAPAVVLLHGAGGNALSWAPNQRRLTNARVFAVDLAGHGKSPGMFHTIQDAAAAVLDFLTALDLPPAVLVGHSMGGAIALMAALLAPQRVAALGLVATSARLKVSPQILEQTANPLTFADAIRTVIQASFSPQVDSTVRTLAAQRMAETPPPVLHADFVACNAFDVRSRLSEITCPTLILCGTADVMTPPRFSEAMAQAIPNARLHLIPDAGHMLMLEEPQVVAQHLQTFLAGLP